MILWIILRWTLGNDREAFEMGKIKEWGKPRKRRKHPVRNYAISVCCTQEEHEAIERLSRLAGVSKSRLLVETALRKKYLYDGERITTHD